MFVSKKLFSMVQYYIIIIIIITVNMFIVQYPMQFRGPPRNVSNLCSAPFYAGEWWFI